ncbi:transcriptional regulator [Desulfitobacterium dichloroeliminans LMG P-21439]|uniref:Transcriptional regulator n=1 Tax=Desulfitobacterium dichloroeliminans (strain LMG P-21439 / DCA1) TaxID=871963 RepID=L0F4U0_DESDL|nr:LysR family transcriptional regulator [Desulfitobacterium dichloroeliminans]AGA68202.1 transcriptional regulator [Desulfitobacterium dichloroeliminans LMG P-21439]
MRIEQLYYLVEVSKNKSLTVAAEQIHVSQQNLSVAIRNLEKEFNVELLVRSHKGISLTSEGEEFVNKAQEILTKIDELNSLFNKKQLAKKVLKGSLCIDVVPYMTLPDILVSFYKLHPQVNVILKEHSPQEIISNVAEGKSDVGIIFRTGEDQGFSETISDLGLNYENILDDKIFVCAGKKSSLKKKRVISHTELFEQNLIVSEDLYGWILDTIKRYQDPSSIQIQKSNSMQIYKKMIEEGLAVGFVTGIGLEKELIFKKGEVVPIAIEKHNNITIGLVYSSVNSQTELCKEFISYLKLTTQDYHC